MTVKVFAPAKVNLTLHVTGQRDDGYHLIDSLVAFAPVGDHLTICDAPASSLTVVGPEAAGVPADKNNLVMQVADIMAPGRGLAITLHKNLPVASGIGGGSADAAAMVRGLSNIYDSAGQNLLTALTDKETRTKREQTIAKAVMLGADIAMCILPGQQRVRGIGEKCEQIHLPSLPVLLANPRISVSTNDVFKVLRQKENAPMDNHLPDFKGVSDFADWLFRQRNDLEAPALKICPDIGKVLGYLRTLDGCFLARMSGSGATCFAIFANLEAAQKAHRKLSKDHPGWWAEYGILGSYSEKAAPDFS